MRKNSIARRSGLVRRVVVPPGPVRAFPRVTASVEQRAKVVGLRCAVCDRTPVDPAHLVPQRLGGCADRDCVIALCRTHHRLYDSGCMRLAPFLGARFGRERAHALTHVGVAELRRALESGWPGPWEIESESTGEEDGTDERR